MSYRNYLGSWTVMEATGYLEPLVKDLGQSFAIAAPVVKSADSRACDIQGGVGLQFIEEILNLESILYDPDQDVLRSTCVGKIKGHRSKTFNVFVVCCSTDPLICKGVIFPARASGIGEDNSVGSWTATKQGSGKPPKKPRPRKRT
ncbi:MAG TPA: hypothetical protein VMM92_15545 [Thermoanaerobaculia bacterium]|nr:hypothetical protein [Thermoanaerobaculia bacterium]